MKSNWFEPVASTRKRTSTGIDARQGSTSIEYAHVAPHSTRRRCPAGQPSIVRVRVPGVQTPSPEHAPNGTYVHVSRQRVIVVPHIPHGAVDVVPGTQTPSPSHGPYSHVPTGPAQKRSRVPHIPHATRS